MKKIVTYHHFKSTGMGGIEVLIRHLQSLPCNNELKFIEVFNEIPHATVHSDFKHVRYISHYTYTSSIRGWWDKVLEKVSVRKAFAKLNLNKQDIIFTFTPLSLLLLPAQVKKNCKIIFVQANSFTILFRSIYKYIFHFNMQYIDAITVYTEIDKVKLINIFPKTAEKIHVIPRGCRLTTAELPSDSSKKLVTIARIDERQKNFQFMIDSFKCLPNEYSLDIYGGGSDREVRSLLEKIKNIRNINYCGKAMNVGNILSKYSLFLMTSNYEGFGQTLIEARSQGLPLVVRNTFDAASVIVKHEENGLLVEGSPYDFSIAIRRIAESPEYINYSSKSLRFARETDINTVSKSWLNCINGI